MGACGTDALLIRFVPVPFRAGAAATSQHVSVQVLVLLNRGARGSTGLEAARVYVRAAAAGRLRLVLLRLHDGRFSGATRGMCIGYVKSQWEVLSLRWQSIA